MSKLVTYAELKEHSNKNSLYILLHEKGASRLLVTVLLTAHCDIQYTMSQNSLTRYAFKCYSSRLTAQN